MQQGFGIIKIFIIIFVVILLALIGLVAYILIAGPIPFGPFAANADTADQQPTDQAAAPQNNMTPEQEAALRQVGVDPNKIPPITPEMQQCFAERLGVERVNQLASGQEPTITDIITAGPCLAQAQQ